ncbi:hypothetical protein F5B22DRAFT_641644 [Xylaria bambusicola]|uniref:uncharacterized protein n=1 Tax=Xylaria bambusicola TaxID=326684 RepID=UPI002007BDDE|nr:uncharacterized protein F5B22DRAFT_641644 [Xylaria bambusicola]KAI0526502.1 hypothetical protein F5B22DRAFT_641644 [Xylaria bambusicola]
MVNGPYARGQYPPRPGYQNPSRLGADYYSQDGRAEAPEWRGPPMTIARGLRDLCQIPGQNFFVAAEDNGRVICLSTPIGSSQLDHEQFFDQNAFLNNINQIRRGDPLDGPDLSIGAELGTILQETGRTRTQSRYSYPNNVVAGYADDATRRSRKRPRASSRQPGSASRQAVEPKKGIRIGDSDAVYAFYDHHLRCCQQSACKMIAKAWVKAVAPKKQSTHPYTRGDRSRPDWWPKVYCKYGEDTYKALRHKEPDHLGKDERVYLLCHILRMIVEPEYRRHDAIRKVNLDLKGLEIVTYDALSAFFGDKDSPSNMSKKPLLQDIFKIARQEARYKDNEISGDTEVFVSSVSDNDAGNDPASDSEDDGRIFTPASSVVSSVEPTGPQMMMSQVQISDHSESGQFSAHGFPQDIAIRGAQYQQPDFESELSERPNYMETHGAGNQASNYSHSHLGLPDMYPSPQGTSRRSSVFNSGSEYGSPATPVTYSPWPTSSAPNNTPMYGFPPQSSNVQVFGQLSQGQSYAPPSIDGLPRQASGAHHTDIFASRTVGHCAIQPQRGFTHYVTTDGASLLERNVKSEGEHQPSISQ